MKDIKTYLEEIVATPCNTIGMGNPEIGTDPLVVKKKKVKKTSAHNIMKDSQRS